MAQRRTRSDETEILSYYGRFDEGDRLRPQVGEATLPSRQAAQYL